MFPETCEFWPAPQFIPEVALKTLDAKQGEKLRAECELCARACGFRADA